MRILLKFDGSLGELVDAVSAAEVIANQGHKIYWEITDVDYVPLLKAQWFTKGVYTGAHTENFELIADLVSNQTVTKMAEAAWRDKLRSAIDARVETIAKENKLKPEQVKKPPEYGVLASNQPIWNRICGYLVTICDAIGDDTLEKTMGVYGLEKPARLAPTGAKKAVNTYLHAKKLSGTPYVLVGDSPKFQEKDLDLSVPHGWVAIDTQGMSPSLITSLASHENCRGVYSYSGGISHVARCPLILEVTDTPEQSYWTSVPRSIVKDLTKLDPISFYHQLDGCYKKIYKISLED